MKLKSRIKFLPWLGFEPRTLQSDGRDRYHSTTAMTLENYTDDIVSVSKEVIQYTPCTLIATCIYAHTHVQLYIHACTYMYQYKYLHTCTYVHTIHTFIHTHLCTYMYTYIRTYM